MPHPVAMALRERPPGARVALVVEGGGMRGAVSGGMALALDELGLAGVSAPRGLGGALTAAALGRLDPALRTAFLTRAEREGADEALLARHDADPALEPAILSIRPAPGSPVPSRLERDVGVVRAGLEAGCVAAHAALG